MVNESPIPNISDRVLREAVRQEYANVALAPRKGYHFHTGREALERIGYDESLYSSLPEENVASFAGTGNPFMLGPIHPGDTVQVPRTQPGFFRTVYPLMLATITAAASVVLVVDRLQD